MFYHVENHEKIAQLWCEGNSTKVRSKTKQLGKADCAVRKMENIIFCCRYQFIIFKFRSYMGLTVAINNDITPFANLIHGSVIFAMRHYCILIPSEYRVTYGSGDDSALLCLSGLGDGRLGNYFLRCARIMGSFL